MPQTNNKPFYKKIWFWIIISLVIVGIILLQNKNIRNQAISLNNKINSIINKKNGIINKNKTRKVTYDKFLKVKLNSTYDEVKGILGEGEKQVSCNIAGIETLIYTWNNFDESKIKITIQNGKVVIKDQEGLSLKKTNISTKKFEKIEQNMNYEQVKQILGEGELTTLSDAYGYKTTIYFWRNSKDFNVHVMFQNDEIVELGSYGKDPNEE